MARINIDAKALMDPRFKALGKLLGGNQFTALGYMVHIWHYCTERQAYFVDKETIGLLTDREDFSELLLKADLAEEENGKLRIRGIEGRIEWLTNLRENGKKGGRPKKEPTQKPDGYDEPKPEGKPSSFENENPLALAPSLAPALTKNKRPSILEIQQCGSAWLETLAHFGVKRKDLMPHENMQISEAIMRLGFVPVLYALTGQRFEKPKDNFNPAEYLQVQRVFKHNNFDRFVNLASIEKEKQEKRKEAETRRELQKQVGMQT